MDDQPLSGLPFPDLYAQLGKEFIVSDWIAITQDRINAFADVTGDHQWIHTDPTRANRDSPFGTTIAHGFLTLSLLPHMMGDFFRRYNIRQGLNYGCEKVRFPHPVTAGSRIRGRFVLRDISDGPMESLKCIVTSTVEIEGKDKPACVAEQVFLLFS